MLLYHGTTEHAARAAMKSCLDARIRHGVNNWIDGLDSNNEVVYLTSAYGCYYAQAAVHAATDPGRIAVIEIDATSLDENKFRPDEVGLEQAMRDHDEFTVNPRTRTAIYQSLITQSPDWRLTLSKRGTCAYLAPIFSSCFTRVAFFDWTQNPSITQRMANLGVGISLETHPYLEAVQKNLTRWLFGSQVSAEQVAVSQADANAILENHRGVEIVRLRSPLQASLRRLAG